MARRRNNRFVKEKTEHEACTSEKKASMVTGIRGTKMILGCSRAKIIAIMQKRNCETGVISLAKKEKPLLQTLCTRF